MEIPGENHHITVLNRLRYEGYNIPSSITKVFFVRDQQHDLQEITESCVIMEELQIKAIILFDAFHASTSRMIANSLDIMYPLSGTVERPGVDGGDMKLYGFWVPQGKGEWGIYSQTKRSTWLNKNGPSALQLHWMAEGIAKIINSTLKINLRSWVDQVDNMTPPSLGPSWGRLGDTPYTTMGLTLNYWSAVHEDKGDFIPSFILRFEKGTVILLKFHL
jgi:hypothetical protein